MFNHLNLQMPEWAIWILAFLVVFVLSIGIPILLRLAGVDIPFPTCDPGFEDCRPIPRW